jgi:amino acid adenylation domain-containing protein
MPTSLDTFFSESVRAHPTRHALFIGGRSWSYLQLDAQCRAIEHALHVAGVAGKRCNIGLVYGRSMFSYAAIIAIMRSDCVYVPLNVKIPAERLQKMIDDARIEALLIDTNDPLCEAIAGTLLRCGSLHVIVPERESQSSHPAMVKALQRHNFWHVPAGNVLPWRTPDKPAPSVSAEPDPQRLAYILFTSGSTGIPKGVAITHASACACIEKAHRLFETHEQDRFTQFSALSFDVSILDLFLCWKSGAALYVADASQALVPLTFVVAHGITVWSSVPSLANILLKLRLLRPNALPQVRLMLFCGEALPCELAEACATAAPKSRVINLYGPTECTIFATYYEYQRRGGAPTGTVPIGIPLPDLECMIVDDGRPVVADDTPGELWIRGDQLAVGYWNNPMATHQAFVPHPDADTVATRWYRTGDLVTHSPEKGLEFRGRLDRQVKLRGHRIELQEIESVLREVIGCTLVAVVPLRNAGGICEQIIAYCDRLSTDEAATKELCLQKIPRYMVPDHILGLNNFPLNNSGKIDYQALTQRAATYAPPSVAPRSRKESQ